MYACVHNKHTEEINIRINVCIKGEIGQGKMWNAFFVNDYIYFAPMSIYLKAAY